MAISTLRKLVTGCCLCQETASGMTIELLAREHARHGKSQKSTSEGSRFDGSEMVVKNARTTPFLVPEPARGRDIAAYDGDTEENCSDSGVEEDGSAQDRPLSSASKRQSLMLVPRFPLVKILHETTISQTVVVRQAVRARRRADKRQYICLKVFHKEYLWQHGFYRQFLGELAAYKRLAATEKTFGDVFVMQAAGVLQDVDRIYLGMKLMQGDLVDVLSDDASDPKVHASRWLAQAAAGISAIHAAGIIHRDIKPENLLLDERNNIIITDFSLAHVAKHAPCEIRKDYSSKRVGTELYIAPEIVYAKGDDVCRYGPMVDYWGLGCVAFELESRGREFPFSVIEDLDLYCQWIDAGHGRAYFKGAGLSDEAEEVVCGLLQIDPQRRYDITNMKALPYFNNKHTGESEFVDIERKARASPACPSVLISEPTPSHEGQPTLIFRPELDVGPNLHSVYDGVGWINPNGFWAGCSSAPGRSKVPV